MGTGAGDSRALGVEGRINPRNDRGTRLSGANVKRSNSTKHLCMAFVCSRSTIRPGNDFPPRTWKPTTQQLATGAIGTIEPYTSHINRTGQKSNIESASVHKIDKHTSESAGKRKTNGFDRANGTPSRQHSRPNSAPAKTISRTARYPWNGEQRGTR